MAAYFGTGTYEVSDNKEVYVIRPTPRWTIREDGIDDLSGKRTLGWRFKVPVAVGLHKFDFDDLPDIIDPDNLGSVSVVPRIELSIPVTRRWTLRPHANVGWGTLMDGSETAWSYWAGVKSRFRLPKLGKMDWALLNSVSYVGYSPEEDKQEDMIPLMAGLDFIVQRQTIEKVGNSWEVGISLAKQGRHMELWRFNFDRIGLGYAESGNGLRGVRICFSSVFDYL